MKTLIVIPARFASTRFPGKPLVEILGKSMIQRVVEQARKVPSADKIIVATDDERIFSHVEKLGFEAKMTRADHVSGTDRVAEIAAQMPDYQLVVNLQGDEPFIQPEQIERLILFLKKNKKFKIGTLAKRIEANEDLKNHNVVKAVFSQKTGRAVYFSRAAVPFVRKNVVDNVVEVLNLDDVEMPRFFKHIGLYGFRSEVLQKLSKLPPSPLELAESLEQLRWLEAGFSIGVLETELETFGIDSPADLLKLSEL